MSRCKAGCMPHRVDPESARHTDDDETEMGDLVIDVKPEPHPWPLQAAGLQRGSLEGAPRSCPIPVPAAARTLLALGLQNQSAPWTSLVPDPHDRQPWTDKHPDTLTCGLCLRTFPLEAIAAFMDHKQQGCQPSRGPSPGPDSELENLKALTCLPCGRQFTEAWTLLRHAQWDHGLSIYWTESEAPETHLLGPAEVAAARSAVAWQEVEAEGSRANSRPRRSPTCPVCMKTLSSFNNLKVHMRSHTGERPYACDQCSYTCAHSSSLTVHRRAHTREPPYTCELCSFACVQRSKLTSHRRMHGLGPGGARFECPHCRVPFRLRATLDRHLCQKHPQAGREA